MDNIQLLRRVLMFVPIEKRSKKQQKEYYKNKRGSWGLTKPYTKVESSGKAYKRNKKVKW